jgi:PAS domain S-box-containing protein
MTEFPVHQASGSPPVRVLLIEDNPGDARLVEEHLRDHDAVVDVRWEQTLSAGLAVLEEEQDGDSDRSASPPDVIVLDLDLPDSKGPETVERCAAATDRPIVVLTGGNDTDTATKALSAGAAESLPKGELTPNLVARTLRWAVRQHRMQRELRARNEWIQSITENAPNGVYRSPVDGGILYANGAFVDLFGYDSVEAIYDLNPEALYADPDERERLRRIERREGEIDGVEIEFRRKDGSTFTGLLSSRIVRDKDGAVQFYDGVIIDITDREERERALRVSEQRYRSLFEDSDDAILVHDLDGRITEANSTAEALFGYDTDALTSQTVFDLHPPEDRDVVDAKLDALRAGEAYRTTCRYERKDKSTFWGEISANVAPVEGTPIGRSMIRDVTEHKEAQYKEARLASIVQSSPDAMLSVDVDRTIQSWNPAAEALYGYTAEEAIGASMMIIIPPEREEELDAFEAQVREGTVVRRETVRQHKNGSSVEVRLTLSPIREDGEIVGASALAQDITEEKQVERQMQHLQKMETVDTLTGGLAHDLNNILHAAVTYVEMTKDDLPEAHQGREFLRRAQEGLGQAEDLVQKLLAFSRPDEQIIQEEVDLRALTDETLHLARSSFPEGIDLRTNTREDGDDEHVLWADPGQLKQVVMNLVTNAVQAMEDGDRGREDAVMAGAEGNDSILDVHIRTLFVDADLATRYLNLDPGPHAVLTVSDTGPGMDAETQDRIFDPFFTTKESGEDRGTGLGLSVVHGIVQAHGGHVQVQSERGLGTTFDVYLPVGPRDADSAGENASSADAAGGARADAPEESADTDGPNAEDASSTERVKGRILVVDDQASLREMEEIRLGRLGYAVETRASGEAALEALDAAHEPFDAVLTDQNMPGMTGLELAGAIRGRDDDVPVVLVSGSAAGAEHMDAADTEAVIRKPVSTDTLRKVLAEIIS